MASIPIFKKVIGCSEYGNTLIDYLYKEDIEETDSVDEFLKNSELA